MGCMPCATDDHHDCVSSIKPYNERSCTDRIPFLAFAVFWFGTAYVTYLAIGKGGDPNRIVHGTDLSGNICGVSADVKNQGYAAWPFPPEYSATVCVADCSETLTATDRMAIPYPSTPFGSFCIPNPTSNATLALILGLSPEFASGSNAAVRAIGDVQTAYPLEAVSLAAALVLSFVYILLLRQFAGLMVWILIGFIIAAGAVGGWALLDRATEINAISPTGEEASMLRGVAYGILAFTSIFALIVFFLRDRIRIAIEVMKEAARAIMKMPLIALFPILTFFLLISYLVFWVIVALYMYSVSDTKTIATPSTVLVNYFTGAALSNSQTMVVYSWTESFQYLFAMHFFGLLWNVQFLRYWSYMSIAGAVADWYFTPKNAPTNSHGGANGSAVQSVHASTRNRHRNAASNDTTKHKSAWASSTETGPAGGHAPHDSGAGSTDVDKGEERAFSSTPVWDSIKRTTRFHLGTIAFGAGIIALIQFIRAVVKYIEMKTKMKNNSLQRCLFCMLNCCLACLECCLDKISKNAFIWTAIWGDSFAPAACGSFKLIWRNLGRVAAINLVSAYLLFIGKVFVAIITTIGAGLVLTQSEPYVSSINNAVVPCIVIFVLSYAVATVFMSTFETVVDTIFLCFMVDSELNAGAGRQMMASVELQELVGHHAESSAEIAKHEQAGKEDPHTGTRKE